MTKKIHYLLAIFFMINLIYTNKAQSKSFRDGFFVTLDPGITFAIGGLNYNADKGWYHASPMASVFTGFEAGYALSFNLGVGLKLAYGLYHNAAIKEREMTDYGVFYGGVKSWYSIGFLDRFFATLILEGGMGVTSPEIKIGAGISPFVGGGIALDYNTHLKEFVVGLEAVVDYMLVGIPLVSIYPRIRYVF